MWGSDYPHDEGTYPFTREHLRQVFSRLQPEPRCSKILAGNAAEALRLRPRRARAAGRSSSARRSTSSRQPLTELPDNPNEALMKAVELVGA